MGNEKTAGQEDHGGEARGGSVAQATAAVLPDGMHRVRIVASDVQTDVTMRVEGVDEPGLAWLAMHHSGHWDPVSLRRVCVAAGVHRPRESRELHGVPMLARVRRGRVVDLWRIGSEVGS